MNKHLMVLLCVTLYSSVFGSEKTNQGSEVVASPLHHTYWENCNSLPSELRTKIDECDSYHLFNKMLYLRDNVSTVGLSNDNILEYCNITLKILPIETEATRNNIQQCSNSLHNWLSSDPNRDPAARWGRDCCKLLKRDECLEATHQVLTDAYATYLRYFPADLQALEYVARIVYHSRLSPKLMTTLLDEKTTPEQFATSVFGTELVRICTLKGSDAPFINTKAYHIQFRDIFFDILIKDTAIPLYFIPTKRIRVTKIAPQKSDPSYELKMDIDYYIPQQEAIPYNLTSHCDSFLALQKEKNKHLNNGAIYFIDKKLIMNMIYLKHVGTEYDILMFKSDQNNSTRTQTLHIDSDQYTYDDFVDNTEKHGHIAVSYFLEQQKKICEKVKKYEEMVCNEDTDEKQRAIIAQIQAKKDLYNQEVNTLKKLLGEKNTFKPYLNCISVISNRIHWNNFKHGMIDLFTGTHAKLAAISSICKYSGILNIASCAIPKLAFLNTCHTALTALLVWRSFSTAIMSLSQSSGLSRTDISLKPVWQQIPLYCAGGIIMLSHVLFLAIPYIPNMPYLLRHGFYLQGLPIQAHMSVYTKKENTKTNISF